MKTQKVFAKIAVAFVATFLTLTVSAMANNVSDILGTKEQPTQQESTSAPTWEEVQAINERKRRLAYAVNVLNPLIEQCVAKKRFILNDYNETVMAIESDHLANIQWANDLDKEIAMDINEERRFHASMAKAPAPGGPTQGHATHSYFSRSLAEDLQTKRIPRFLGSAENTRQYKLYLAQLFTKVRVTSEGLNNPETELAKAIGKDSVSGCQNLYAGLYSYAINGEIK